MERITPKENYLLALNHKIPQWIPNMATDVNLFMPQEVAERAPGDGSKEQAFGGTGKDWFGVHWAFQPSMRASAVDPAYPPVLDDITKWKETVRFPDIDSIDWKKAAERDTKNTDSDKLGMIILLNGPFERLFSLMGMEEACCAMILEPKAVFDFFQAVTDFRLRLIDKLLEYYPLDLIEVHDDWGHQGNTFFSPQTWCDLIQPYVRRMTGYAKRKGIHFQFHSCGKINAFIPLMIESGIECWSGQSINDIENILKNYGDRLLVFGAMDLPEFRDPLYPDEKKQKVALMRIRNLCRGGAFIPNRCTILPSIQQPLAECNGFFDHEENRKLPG